MNTGAQNEYSCAKFLNLCLCFKPFLNSTHQIHPSDPSGPKYSEFLAIDKKKTLRVIHVKPDTQNIPRMSYEHDKRLSISRHSLTEEYWFTRWSKPLRGASCNCSFRRSLRYSKLSDHVRASLRQKNSLSSNVNDTTTARISTYDLPATKITNIETFVERLIQDTYFEALQEYLIKVDKINSGLNGIDNLAYHKSIDDVDGVVLRRKNYNSISKEAAILPVECITTDGDKILTNKNQLCQSLTVQNINKKLCIHKNDGKKKPLVILLHGIGSTADIWWNIIHKLQIMGFEIVAPDMLGHGYSTAPNLIGAYKFKNLLRHAIEVFDHYVSNDMKAIVIGHSFGCSLATALARYRMQQVVQLILISGGGPTPLAAPTEIDDTTNCNCSTFLKPLVFCGLKRSFFYSSRGKCFKPCEVTHGIPSYVLKYIEKGQNWLEGDAAFHRRILIPTLLVHGLQDTSVTLVQECEMERTIPRAFLELIPNAGHMSMLEAPEHLSHMISCFLDWWNR